MTNAPTVRYLVYDQDGAGLVYSGVDEAAYRAARARTAERHAGALVGQCMMGRERWIIASYLRAMPDPAFIRRRREGGLFGLTWEATAGPA